MATSQQTNNSTDASSSSSPEKQQTPPSLPSPIQHSKKDTYYYLKNGLLLDNNGVWDYLENGDDEQIKISVVYIISLLHNLYTCIEINNSSSSDTTHKIIELTTVYKIWYPDYPETLNVPSDYFVEKLNFFSDLLKKKVESLNKSTQQKQTRENYIYFLNDLINSVFQKKK